MQTEYNPEPYDACPDCGGRLNIFCPETRFSLQGEALDWGDEPPTLWCLDCDAFADGHEPEDLDRDRFRATIERAFPARP